MKIGIGALITAIMAFVAWLMRKFKK